MSEAKTGNEESTVLCDGAEHITGYVEYAGEVPGKVSQVFSMQNTIAALTESGDLFVLSRAETKEDGRVGVQWDYIPGPSAEDMAKHFEPEPLPGAQTELKPPVTAADLEKSGAA